MSYGYQYGLIDTVAFLVLFPLCYIVYRSVFKENSSKKYFQLNFFYHLFFALAYTIIHIEIFGGGDTLAYFKTIKAINNIVFVSIPDFFEQIFSGNQVYNFSGRSSPPPSWIFREDESFFVCQVLVLPSLLSFNSLIGFSVIMAFLTSVLTWSFYLFVSNRYEELKPILGFGLLFIPSVTFWCSALSKDTLVYLILIILVILSFNLLEKVRFSRLVLLMFFSWLLLNIRSVVFYSFLASISFVLVLRLLNRLSLSPALKVFLKFTLLLVVLSITVNSVDFSQSEDEFLKSNIYLNQAAVTQQDFLRNSSYGQNKYSLGDFSFTPIGLLLIFPKAFFYGVFSPFIWQSFSATLIFNGLEGTVFIFLFGRFIFKGVRSMFRQVLKDELLLFSIVFVLSLGFVTGLTSVLFGVLVRLRAPLLPFLILLLVTPKLLDSKS